MPASSERFGADYYRRFYLESRSAVVSAAEMRSRARFIAAFVEHVGCPVRRILDAGCGLGLMRAPLGEALPRASYTGLDPSPWLCEQHGWELGTLESYRSARPFDLVVCYDVLQYLDDRAASRALANLPRLCRGVLYFSALTREDWRRNCDRRRTDRDVAMRPASWYRTRLSRGFRQAGAGFWLRRGAPLVVWELEKAG